MKKKIIADYKEASYTKNSKLQADFDAVFTRNNKLKSVKDTSSSKSIRKTKE